MKRVWESKALASPALTATLLKAHSVLIVQSVLYWSMGNFMKQTTHTHSFVCFHLSPTPLVLNRHGEWLASALSSCPYFAKPRTHPAAFSLPGCKLKLPFPLCRHQWSVGLCGAESRLGGGLVLVGIARAGVRGFRRQASGAARMPG